VTDDHIARINRTPMTPIPDDTIRTHGPVRVMLGAAPDRSISVGLLIQAQPPLGPIEVYLTGEQLKDLAEQLQSLVNLDADETTALIDRLHGGGQ
jgi:hypothetical protein